MAKYKLVTVEVRFKAHRGNQKQIGSVRVRFHVSAGTPRRVR